MNSKKWFWIVVAIPFVLILLTEILLMWQSKGLKNKVKDISEAQIEGELTLSSAKLSLLKSFPDIGLWIENPTITVEGDTLLHVRDAGLKLQIWPLLFGEINFKSIHFYHGEIQLRRAEKNGRWNFDILKEQEKSTGEIWDLAAGRIVLKDIAVSIKDGVSKLEMDVLAKSTSARGSFIKENISFSLVSELVVNSYSRKGRSVLQDINLNFELDIKTTDNETRFENVVLFLGESKLKGEGRLARTEGGKTWNMDLDGNAVDLIQVLELAGITQKEITQGKFDAVINAGGSIPLKGEPAIAIEYEIKNGSVGGGFFSSGITGIVSSGKYEYSPKSSILRIKEFNALNGKNPIKAQVEIKDFAKPSVEAVLSGSIPASWLIVLAPGLLSNIRGELTFNQFEVRIPGNKRQVSGKGSVSSKELAFDVNNSTLKIRDFLVGLSNQKLNIKLQEGAFLGGKASVSGDINNWANLVSNAGLVGIEIEANLDDIDVKKWMAQWDSLSHSGNENRKSDLQLELKSNITVNNSYYGDVKVDQARVQLSYNKDKLSWGGEAKAMGGIWKLDHSLHLWPLGGFSLRGDTECEDVEIVKLFTEFHDFGQEFISYKHLSGKLYAKSIMDLTWNKDGDLIEDKMNLLIGARISKGELKGFPLLENFSSFVKIDDLKHIKFSEIINIVDISGGKIYIPAMFIQSNALNMDISGEHSFSHDMLYHFKINAGQILTRKFEKHDARLLPVKAEKSGWFNIYYQITGTPDNFTYVSNKRAVKSHFDAMYNRFNSGIIRLENKFGEINWLRYPSDWSDVRLFDSKESGKTIEYLDNF